ncbi:MAG: polysaccharide deacetylase family protein [Ruminococcus sp.]|nr:polysaccharide deacetylase family protein [Ruminococcus sp.]
MFNNYSKSYYNTRRRRRRRRRSSGGKKLLLFLVVLLVAGLGIFAAVTAFSPKCAPVTELKTSKITSGSVALSWKGAEGTDGYYVYERKNESDEFSRIGEIKNKKTQSYNVSKLKPVTDYEFCVTGYKKGDKENVESTKTTVKAFTIPNTPKITRIEAQNESEILVEWEKLSGAKVFQLQYQEGEKPDFKSAKVQNVSAKANQAVIKGLKKNSSYGVRIRCGVTHEEKKVYSAWSKSNLVFVNEDFVYNSSIDPNKPMVALTFDDGPGFNKASDKILDTLEKYNARATFFMVGYNASVQPENIKRKAALGMELGNHTWDHKHYGANVTASDIKKASKAIYKICGKYPTAFRSPGGMTTTTIKNECKAENMALYYWSIDTEDWKTRNANSTINSVMNSVSDGDIILMHEIYDQTAVAVEKLVPKLMKAGYQLVTCQELIKAKSGKDPEAGVQYVSGRY